MNNSTHFKAEFSTNSPPLPRISRDLAIFVIAIYGINILVATFGNARVLFLLRRRRDLRKVPHFRGTTTNSVTLVTVTLAASMNVAIPFLHHKMLQVRPPNQQSTDQPRVTAWRAAARPKAVDVE